MSISTARQRWRVRPTGRLVIGGLMVVAMAGPAILPAAASAAVASTERVSVDSGSGGGRELPVMTPDGDRVAFVGRGESNRGVWLRDRSDAATYRITTGSHFNPAISDDGKSIAYVVYGSSREVFVRDITDPAHPGAAELVSSSATGQTANGLSDYPSISADGRHVAFQSMASNLTPETPLPSSGGPNKVYVKDRSDGAIEMVSVDNTGAAQPGNGVKPDITPDGNNVAFASEAVLDPPPATIAAHGPPPGHGGGGEEVEEETTFQQIYVRDRAADTTSVVSKDDDGVLGNGSSALEYGPTISDDGNRVAFESEANNLVPADTNSHTDAFLRDRTAGTTVRVDERAPFDEFGAFHPLSPDRVLDTRDATPVGPGQTIEVDITGASSVPLGAAGVAVNVTAVNATAPTHLTVFANGTTMPPTSTLNVSSAAPIANAATVKLGADGKLAVFNNSESVDVVVDVEGWYDAATVTAGGGFHPNAPDRLLDTRDAVVPVGPGETIDVTVAGTGAAPTTATAVALNVTAVGPSAASHLTVYPNGDTQPLASNLNFVAGQTIANSVVTKVGTDGKVRIFNNSGTVHMVVDLDGWFDGTLPGGGVSLVTPARLVDTRTTTPLGPAESRDLGVIGTANVPAIGVTGVVLNVTAVAPTEPSHLTVYATGTELPLASNLNFVAGQTIANQVLAQVGVDGKVTIRNNSGTTHVLVDVAGWVSGVQVIDGAGGPAISGDGAVVSFESTASTLTAGDTNGVMDVFVHTVATKAVERVSVVDETSGGVEATGTRTEGHTGETVPQTNGGDPAIGADGQLVVFVSNGNLANDRPVGEEEAGEISTEAAVFLRTRA